MATNDLGLFNQVVLDGTMQTVYTVTAGHTIVPKTISITNFTSSTSLGVPKVSIWFVKDGEVAGDKNILIPNKPIILEAIFINTDMYLQAGFSIVVKASIPNCLNCQLSGVDMY